MASLRRLTLPPLVDRSTSTPSSDSPASSQLGKAHHQPRLERLSAWFRRFWLLETLWCLVGLACAAAIIVVLAQYDGNKAPEWPLGISLNTFLAFFASVAKAALLVPVTEGLGQLRWIWFTGTPRRVYDFELFDSSTRGSFGSLRLLLSLKGGCVLCAWVF